VQLEIIGKNEKTYETRRRVIHLLVPEKPDPPVKNIVHMKIDNVDVEHLLNSDKLSKLLDIFRHKLWVESFADLHTTFLSSAVNQGARRPLKPNESEG